MVSPHTETLARVDRIARQLRAVQEESDALATVTARTLATAADSDPWVIQSLERQLSVFHTRSHLAGRTADDLERVLADSHRGLYS